MRHPALHPAFHPPDPPLEFPDLPPKVFGPGIRARTLLPKTSRGRLAVRSVLSGPIPTLPLPDHPPLQKLGRVMPPGRVQVLDGDAHMLDLGPYPRTTPPGPEAPASTLSPGLLEFLPAALEAVDPQFQLPGIAIPTRGRQFPALASETFQGALDLPTL